MKRFSVALLSLLFIANISFGQGATGHIKKNSDYFPIAVWAQSPSNAAAYKKLGINTFVSMHQGLNQEKLDQLRESGMKVICHQNEFGLKNLSDPVIYGWMHGDEPDNAQAKRNGEKGWDPCIDPAKIIADYHKIKEKDPSRPVYLNLGMGVSHVEWFGRGECTGKWEMYKVSNNGYLKGCDIGSFDIYPTNTDIKAFQNKLWYVPKGIDSLKVWSDNKKPVWCWIETTRISKEGRKPTPSEVKSEVWMALIHGANGFGYFCHSFYPTFVEAGPLQDPEMMAALTSLNSQITALAPVLNSDNTKGYATVSSSNAEVPVDIMTKSHKNDNYIFAVAMREGNTSGTFTVKKGKNVEVLGENRTIKIKNGKFTDNFPSYGVHLYKISK